MPKMKFGLVLIMLAFASENHKNKDESAKSKDKFKEKNAEDLILVKIEEDEYTKAHKNNSSKYIGVTYNVALTAKWRAQRRSKKENKAVYNGSYKDEETAAHASDTLARKLMENGEQKFKLNFPDDDTKVFPEDKKISSTYFGVSYIESNKTWYAQRRSKSEKTMVHNGSYKDEETAAHASDTLARTLMANGEQNHKLNFPDDDAEVHREEKTKSSEFIGVSYNKIKKIYESSRWSKSENKSVHNGTYKNEEAAAHASDTLARKFIANGEQNHRLNFPEGTEQRNKRKRSEHEDVEISQIK